MQNNKTTIIGIIGAIWLAIQPIISTGTFNFSTDWKNLLGAALIAVFAFVAKDFNVTGGTVANSKNDASVVQNSTQHNKGL